MKLNTILLTPSQAIPVLKSFADSVDRVIKLTPEPIAVSHSLKSETVRKAQLKRNWTKVNAYRGKLKLYAAIAIHLKGKDGTNNRAIEAINKAFEAKEKLESFEYHWSDPTLPEDSYDMGVVPDELPF
jgi:hypothetical protein